MEMQGMQGLHSVRMNLPGLKLSLLERESSATIKAPPASYKQASPPKPQNIIEIDCRGLEFTEFKADVRLYPCSTRLKSMLTCFC